MAKSKSKATPAQLRALKKARAALRRKHGEKKGRKKGSKKRKASKSKTHILSGKYKLVGMLQKA